MPDGPGRERARERSVSRTGRARLLPEIDMQTADQDHASVHDPKYSVHERVSQRPDARSRNVERDESMSTVDDSEGRMRPAHLPRQS
jgi:hypothetical protein